MQKMRMFISLIAELTGDDLVAELKSVLQPADT